MRRKTRVALVGEVSEMEDKGRALEEGKRQTFYTLLSAQSDVHKGGRIPSKAK